MITKNNEKKLGGCDDALLIYGAPKSITVYVVKWAFLGLQQAPENSVLAPSSQDLLALVLQLSVTMMSWVRVWLDLRLFTTQFSDKSATSRYLKVKKMTLKEILRRIWFNLLVNNQVKLELNSSFWQIIAA